MKSKNKEKIFDVFISYRRGDTSNIANQIESQLKTMGYSVFLDTQNNYSGEYREKLRYLVSECTDFLLILGPDTFNLPDLQDNVFYEDEICTAVKCKKNIVPVLSNKLNGNIPGIPDNFSKEVKETLKKCLLKNAFVLKGERFLDDFTEGIPEDLQSGRRELNRFIEKEFYRRYGGLEPQLDPDTLPEVQAVITPTGENSQQEVQSQIFTTLQELYQALDNRKDLTRNLIVTGESGIGKTYSAYDLLKRLFESEEKVTVPLLIDFTDINIESIHAAIDEKFKHHCLLFRELELKPNAFNNITFTVVIDGLDRIAETDNMKRERVLDELQSFFYKDYSEFFRFVLLTQREIPQLKKFSSCKLRELSPERVRLLLSESIKNNENLEDIIEAVRLPIFISIVKENLEVINAAVRPLSDSTITNAYLIELDIKKRLGMKPDLLTENLIFNLLPQIARKHDDIMSYSANDLADYIAEAVDFIEKWRDKTDQSYKIRVFNRCLKQNPEVYLDIFSDICVEKLKLFIKQEQPRAGRHMGETTELFTWRHAIVQDWFIAKGVEWAWRNEAESVSLLAYSGSRYEMTMEERNRKLPTAQFIADLIGVSMEDPEYFQFLFELLFTYDDRGIGPRALKLAVYLLEYFEDHEKPEEWKESEYANYLSGTAYSLLHLKGMPADNDDLACVEKGGIQLKKVLEYLDSQSEDLQTRVVLSRVYSNLGAWCLAERREHSSDKESATAYLNQAVYYHNKAREIREALTEEKHGTKAYLESLAVILKNLGTDYFYLGDYLTSLSYLKNSLKIREDLNSDRREDNYIRIAGCLVKGIQENVFKYDEEQMLEILDDLDTALDLVLKNRWFGEFIALSKNLNLIRELSESEEAVETAVNNLSIKIDNIPKNAFNVV